MSSNDLTKFESILLRKLYFCKFEKKLLATTAGSLADISRALGDICNYVTKYSFLNKMIEVGILKLESKDAENKKYVIDKEKIVSYLMFDRNFRYDYMIIEANAKVLIDNLPKMEPELI